MKKELEQKFIDRWPNWFRNMYGNPCETCLCFGFECGDGWFDLLWKLCEDIEKENPDEDFLIEQIKEKFGGLRFYTSGANNNSIYDLIDKAEQQSYKVCENCGSTENVTSEGSWIKTLCKKCRKE